MPHFEHLNAQWDIVCENFYKKDCQHIFAQAVLALGKEIAALPATQGQAFLQQNRVNPLAFLISADVPLEWIATAMQDHALCNYMDRSVLWHVAANSQLMDHNAVEMLFDLDQNNTFAQWLEKDVQPTTVLRHPHSTQALMVWQRHLKFKRQYWNSALHTVLSEMDQHNEYKPTLHTNTPAALIEVMDAYNLHDSEFFRNTHLHGLMYQDNDVVERCFAVFSKWVNTNPEHMQYMYSVMYHLQKKAIYMYGLEQTQSYIAQKRETMEEHYALIDQKLIENKAFNAHLQRFFVECGLDVMTMEENILGTVVDKMSAGFAWECFLKDSTVAQWQQYRAAVDDKNPLCTGIHAILCEESAYQHKSISMMLPDNTNSNKRKI